MQVVSRFRLYVIFLCGWIFVASTHKFILNLRLGLDNEIKTLITVLFFGLFLIGFLFGCIVIGEGGLYFVFGIATGNGTIKGYKTKIGWSELTFTVVQNWAYTTIYLGSGKASLPLIWGFLQTNPQEFIEYISTHHPEKLKIL